jgi:hypothetical protein
MREGNIPWDKAKNAVRPREAHDGLVIFSIQNSIRYGKPWPAERIGQIHTKQMYSEKSKPAV